MIFISYRRSQLAAVEPVVRLLQANGIAAFFDLEDIDPLVAFPRRIEEGIAGSHALLAWWSRDYGESDHCLNEFRLAWQHARRQSSDVGRRLWIINPGDDANHIAAGDLGEQNFLAPPAPGAEAAFVERIARCLADLLPSGPLADEHGAPSASPMHSVPFGNVCFTGRNRELMRIHGLAHPPRIGAQSRDVAIQTHGMGGVGKTELALQYARSFTDAYPGGVFWIDLAGFEPGQYAEDRLAEAAGSAWTGALESAVAEDTELRALLRDPEGRPRPVAEVRGLFARKLGEVPSLWVLDNVPHFRRTDQRDRILELWRAPGARGRTLVTTRDSDPMSGFAVLGLEVLSPEDGLRLLARYLPPADAGERQAAEQAVADLGSHPQALNLLGRRVQMEGTPDAYRKAQRSIDDEGALPRIEAIAEQLAPQLGAKARGIVASLALSLRPLDDDDQAMLLLAAAGAPGVPLPRKALLAAMGDGDRAVAALASLLRHSLLGGRHDAADHCVDLHSLVAETARFLLDPEREIAPKAQTALALALDPLLAQTTGDLTRRRQLAEAARHARYLFDRLAVDDLRVELGLSLGQFHQRNASLPAAQEILGMTHELARKALGEEHLRTLTTMNNLAGTLRAQGDLAGARALQESVLATLRRVLGAEHPETLTSMNNLAGTLHAQGDLAGAQALHESELAICHRVLGEEHPNTLISRSNVANVLRAQGNLAGAKALHESVLATRRRVLGAEHRDTLTSMNNLAGTLQSQGDLAGARALHELVLATLRRVLGEEHPHTLSSMNNLALTLQSQGDFVGARALQESALATLRRVLGAEHPETLTSMNNLALTLQSQGDFVGARALHESVLATLRRVLGAEHPHTLSSMNNLAGILENQGNLAGARALHESVLAIRRRVLGEEHPDTLDSGAHLANSLWHAGKPVAAAAQMRAVADGLTRVLGQAHANTIAVRSATEAMQAAIDDARKQGLLPPE